MRPNRTMTTKYGRSPWLDQFPKSRVPSYPRYRGASAHDVVIVGGGLTGCATAYALAANGIGAVLLESDRIGRGSTAYSAGWIGDDPGVPFAEVETVHGRRAARAAWQGWRRAALDFAALLRRLEIKVEPLPAAIVALSREQATTLAREQKMRRAAGLDAAGVPGRVLGAELGLAAAAGLRLKDGAVVDPYRAALGLAAAADARGAQLFERSPVAKITFDRKAANVVTAAGTIRARRVIVATGAPTALFKALARHFWFRTTYAALTDPIPAKIRRELGARPSVFRDGATPSHVVRRFGEDRLLITGGDQDTPPVRQREKAIVQRTGQLMYELSLMYPAISGIQPAYGWEAPYVRTDDGLPYVGAHRNFPHQLLAWGGTDATFSYLASRIALRFVSDELDRADEIFGFNR